MGMIAQSGTDTQHPGRPLRPRRAHIYIYIAVLVCSPESADELAPLVDTFMCLAAPPNFMAVGQFYWHFPQVSDGQVMAALRGETRV